MAESGYVKRHGIRSESERRKNHRYPKRHDSAHKKNCHDEKHISGVKGKGYKQESYKNKLAYIK